MEKSCWIILWKKRQNLVVAHCALRVISIFMGKSGFTFASEFGIRYHGLPEDADSSFFLCKELIPGYLNGITGEYATPQGYFVNEEEAEKFDKTFPYKEKLKLPGQLF